MRLTLSYRKEHASPGAPLRLFVPLLLALALTGCNLLRSRGRAVELSARQTSEAAQVNPHATPLERVNAAAIEQTTQTTAYDPAYVRLTYPNGDVPIATGVCADVVVRAFRRGGVDLQQKLHEDMRANFKQYPQRWGAKRADSIFLQPPFAASEWTPMNTGA